MSRSAINRQHQSLPMEQLERRVLLASQPYTWQYVNIPAGGFVDGIFYDPHNQNVMYARTDVGGLFKSVNDGGNWTELLNWVGNNTSGSGNGTQFQEYGVLSFAIDPENSNNLYAMVGEYAGTNGDVLYSTNAGATWNTTPLSFYVGGNEDGRGAGERIAVDPYDSNIILLGSNANGLWESTNAGQSFTQLTSLSTSASINLVLFDPYGGTAGSPTQKIFVGESSTASGTNLYESTNGGTSFAEVTGTGSAPTGWMPNRAVMASDGNLYVAYANDQAPTEPTNGGIMRYNTATGVWANISPVKPQVSNGDDFGYCGIALDPNSSTTLVVTSLDRYAYDDAIWRTTNANASSPSWVALYNDTTLYHGYNATRNTTNAPYMASAGDGITNWATDVAIDPFNSAQIMHNFGGGIWATNDGTSTTTLTAPNSWYFPDNGIGMTAILGLAAANGGTPLYSGMGDVGGFAFTNMAFSPTQGNIYANGGNGSSVDSAGLAPLDAALVGNMGATDGFYTTNGTTFTAFAENPNTFSVSSLTQSGGVATAVTSQANTFSAGQSVTLANATPSAYDGTFTITSIVSPTTFQFSIGSGTANSATGTITATVAYSNGTVAESANGSTLVWAPSDEGPYYSTNHAASWSASNLVASVSSINQSGGVPTAVTAAANNFSAGQYVTITGATPSAYDGTYVIASIVNSTTFTYTDANTNSSTGTPATGTITASLNGTIVSDKVNPNYFYYWTENSSDSTWTLYISSNGGESFTESTGGSMGNGNVTLVVNPYVAGQLWISSYLGLYESTNFGASFTKIGGYYGIGSIALGAPAPGESVPTIYIYGTPAGDTFEGIYRSDDGGNTWVLLNDVNHQFGGTGPLAADPNVFGRIYLGAGGIVMGNPATSLPTGWTDSDINEPGNPGWATSSTTLSTGTTVNQWNIVGGGAGFSSSPISISSLSRTGGVATAVTTTASGLQIGQTITIAGATNTAYDGTFVVTGLYNTTAGLANDIGAATEFTFAIASGTDTASGTITATLDDQFNFAYQPVMGSAVISAQIHSITNADAGNGTPQAGVMYRASTNPNDPFFAVVQTAAGNLELEYRATAGGGITTQTITGIPVGSEYVEIVRNGTAFTGFYSSSGTTWTQIGFPVSIPAIPSTAVAGLAVSANYNPQLSSATFSNVAIVPATYTDTTGNNTYAVRINPAIPGQLQIFVNVPESSTPTYQVTLSQLPYLDFNCGSGADTLTVDETNGNPIPAGGLTLNSGSGTDSLVVLSATASTTANITVNDNALVNFNAGTGTTLNYIPISTLNISSSALAVVTASTTVQSRSVLVTSSLNFVGTSGAWQGLLNLNGNDMVIHGGNITSLTNQVMEGYNTGGIPWQGSGGIISKIAAADSTHLTAIGVIQNSVDGTTTGTALYSNASGSLGLFDGISTVDTDVLLKHTYIGDSNLDGKVDGSDFSRIDSAWKTNKTGWFNGDFNYDSIINGSDYTLIDNAFNTQGASMTAMPANAVASPATKPTPTSASNNAAGNSHTLKSTTLSALAYDPVANSMQPPQPQQVPIPTQARLFRRLFGHRSKNAELSPFANIVPDAPIT